jgi:hypothetical protein
MSAEAAYNRLADAIQAGREITLPDEQLLLAAYVAVDSGYPTTARLALRELIEREEAA